MKKELNWDKQNQEFEEKEKKETITQNIEKMTRYYFWDWCISYGWRQMGSGDGYETIKECWNDNKYSIGQDWDGKKEKYSIGGPSSNWKILKAEIIESKKLNK